jgi:hypothetical protein
MIRKSLTDSNVARCSVVGSGQVVASKELVTPKASVKSELHGVENGKIGGNTVSIERMAKRIANGTYQGIRHLMPRNLSPLRSGISKEQGRKQLASLKEVNRSIPLHPPFVHRPEGRYLSSVLMKTELTF